MRISDERSNQEGFTLAALLVILTIIALVVAYTVPEQWSLIMKRERDRQTVYLMKQYARGILAWETKNRGLPVSLEQIQEARDPRLIRGTGKWACPITGGEDDWILVPPGAITPDGQVVPTNTTGLNSGFGNNNTSTAGKKDASNKVGIGMPDGGNQNSPQNTTGQTGKLNPEASPADYVGPFVAVRPNVTGKSFITLNGAEDYGEWVYSLQDLKNEIAMQQMALQAK
ncbi:MAG TPA: hypothetical protein VF608_01355 [Thermoanaerobaculia bacterium]